MPRSGWAGVFGLFGVVAASVPLQACDWSDGAQRRTARVYGYRADNAYSTYRVRPSDSYYRAVPPSYDNGYGYGSRVYGYRSFGPESRTDGVSIPSSGNVGRIENESSSALWTANQPAPRIR